MTARRPLSPLETRFMKVTSLLEVQNLKIFASGGKFRSPTPINSPLMTDLYFIRGELIEGGINRMVWVDCIMVMET